MGVKDLFPNNNICITTSVLTNGGNTTDIIAQCEASWELTTEQIYYSFFGFIILFIISIIWILITKYQRKYLLRNEICFSHLLRNWARKSRKAAFINRPIQFIISIGIYLLFIKRCTDYTVTYMEYNILTGFYIISLLDDIIRYLKARHKILYLLSPYTILEILMIGSHIVLGYGTLKYINVNNNNLNVPSRTWLDFSVMRTIFIYRSFNEMEKHFNKKKKKWALICTLFKCMLLVLFAAGVIFFFETLGEISFFTNNGFAHLYSCNQNGTITRIQSEDCSTETWSVMFAFYFTIVTLGTVGYGDNAPGTVISRLLIIIFIVAGIVVFSNEIENWIAIYKLNSVGNPSYKLKPRTIFVIMIGNPTFKQLRAILHDYFHEDHLAHHPGYRLHAILLGPKSSKYANNLITKIEKDPEFRSQVFFIAGDPMNPDDMDRSCVKEASSVFIFPDKFANNPDEEDTKNIMTMLAIKRHTGGSVRCLMCLLKSENLRQVLAVGMDRDDVICLDIIQMGTLALSSVIPGYSTLIANLSSCLSMRERKNTNNDKKYENGVFNMKRTLSDSIDGKKMKSIFNKKSKSASSTNHSEALIKDEGRSHKNDKKIKHSIYSKRKNFIRASKRKNTVDFDLESIETSESYRLFNDKNVLKSYDYQNEYIHGACKEVYAVQLQKAYISLTFASAAKKAFQESNGHVVLFAVEIYCQEIKDNNEDINTSLETNITNCSELRVLLSPGNSLLITKGMKVFVIADDLDSIYNYNIGMDVGLENINDLMSPYINNNHKIDKEKEKGKIKEHIIELEMKESISIIDGNYAELVTPSPLPILPDTMKDEYSEISHGSIRMSDTFESYIIKTANIYKALDRNSSYIDDIEKSKINNDIFTISSYIENTENKSFIITLTPPTLDVLHHPEHIVVCSNFGTKCLERLKWFFIPLRLMFPINNPITILDNADLDSDELSYLKNAKNIYFVKGSSLNYYDLQRAGAQSAKSVIILSNKKNKYNDMDHIDNDAILTTLLIEMKINKNQIRIITELIDENNATYMTMKKSIRSSLNVISNHTVYGTNQSNKPSRFKSFWNHALETDKDYNLKHNVRSIYEMPLYMAGRLFHPQICENLLIQSFFNPNIHRIIRQLMGSPMSTGCIWNYKIPENQRDKLKCYRDVFLYFLNLRIAAITLGIYRIFPSFIDQTGIVITNPSKDFKILDTDSFYVLIGCHSLHEAAVKIKNCFFRVIYNLKKNKKNNKYKNNINNNNTKSNK